MNGDSKIRNKARTSELLRSAYIFFIYLVLLF